jgi:hypothetical protein
MEKGDKNVIPEVFSSRQIDRMWENERNTSEILGAFISKESEVAATDEEPAAAIGGVML